MNAHTKIDDAFPIEQALRPVTQANRLLRDFYSHRLSLTGRVADDPPDLGTIERSIDALKSALAMPATAENITTVIMQMIAGTQSSEALADELVAAVVNRDALSVALDGMLPLAAIASAASRYRSAARPPDPEAFLRACVKEHCALLETLESLQSAEITMRGRLGWYR
jgi:hypothetical protein